MIDILYKVHEVISQDRIIREHVNINNIKFNKYPNVKDTDVPFIVIDDIDDPIPTSYTDGDECAYNVSNGKPEYIEEFKTYRSSRVYEGIFYKEEN